MVLERGTLLNNRYRIVDILGQGGMGSVYRAIDENLGVEVAVKDNLFTTEEYARQFKREAIILANLRHPNLPRVTDHFVISGQGQYLVMDFIEGEDLRQRMERVGIIAEEEVITIGAAVCDALAFLGSRKPPVIHRDLKPGNVKISPQGEIYLVDFGLAKTMHDIHTTATGARAMTPGYSPPEQYGGARTDQRSDVYSLGATLYAALTNAIPEDGLARAMDQAELTPLRKMNPRISRRLASAIEKSLNVRPDDRFQTADEFKQALLAASSSSRRKENGRAVVPVSYDGKPIPEPHLPASENLSNARAEEVAIGYSPASADSQPRRKSSKFSRSVRKYKLQRWLPAMALAVLAAGIGVYLFLPGWLNQVISGNISSFMNVVISPTASRISSNSIAVVPTSADLTHTASPASQVKLTLSPTLIDTPRPTSTITPIPTLLGGSRLIAYASESTGKPQIFVINSDGTGKRQVTDLVDGACQPDWSPDGLRLVFISPCKENINYYPTSGLFIINLDGTGLLPLPKVSGGDFDPDWSPDGTKIAFASTRVSGRPQIFIMAVDGQEYQIIPKEYSYETQPSWSSDGQQLLYIQSTGSDQQIWVMDPVGVNRRQVSEDTGYINSRPSFLPDGNNILFTQRLRPGAVPFLSKSPFGGDEFKATRVGQDEPMPMQEGLVSPDGLWIVFEGWAAGTDHDIYIMTVTGLARTRITTDPANDFDPAWSPAGTQ